MRSLTVAEARVIQALLANVPGNEREHIQQAGVPRSTYQAVRRRAFLSGWLHERYLPDPTRFGISEATFALIQPFAEHRLEVTRALRLTPGTALLWSSPDTLLSVAFGPRNKGALDPAAFLGRVMSSSHWIRRSWSIRADLRQLSVPVYFDYEGAWSRWVGTERTISYPQGLGTTQAHESTPLSRPLSGNALKIAQSLLAHHFRAPFPDGSKLRLGMPGLSRRERSLVGRGWIDRRVFPDIVQIPPLRGRRIERIVFVTGSAQERFEADDFLQKLIREGKVAPFLLVKGSKRVLLATLSPAPRDVPATRRSVLELLQGFLREIEIVREPLETFFPVIDHRYDQIVSGTGGDSEPST